MVRSKNAIDCVDCSNVNLMESCMLFINHSRLISSEAVPRKLNKMSSMNRFQNSICVLYLSMINVSRIPINRFAYGGAMRVPIDVPVF